jgi:hypothetical protein
MGNSQVNGNAGKVLLAMSAITLKSGGKEREFYSINSGMCYSCQDDSGYRQIRSLY